MNDLGLPKYCDTCNKPCGGMNMPAAWALYDGREGYWLCERHYQEWFLTESRRIEKEERLEKEEILTPLHRLEEDINI